MIKLYWSKKEYFVRTVIQFFFIASIWTIWSWLTEKGQINGYDFIFVLSIIIGIKIYDINGGNFSYKMYLEERKKELQLQKQEIQAILNL